MHGQQSIKKRSYSYFAVSLPSYITSLEMRLLFGRTMFWISNEMPRRSKTWVCGPSLGRIACSNHSRVMYVFCDWCVLLGL